MGKVLSWGQCDIKRADYTGEKPTSFKSIDDNPKQNTVKVTPTEGAKHPAKATGGVIVDQFQEDTEYTIEFQNFVKKGAKAPLGKFEGAVDGAFQIIPKNQNFGIQANNCTGMVTISYTDEEGIMLNTKLTVAADHEGKTVFVIDHEGKAIDPSTGNATA